MTRILFVCSGNTCRSPVAAAVAHSIFGLGHRIASAGAETDVGARAAANAITALADWGLDLSQHETQPYEQFSGDEFDVIVVFRPSAAQSLSFPTGTWIAYFDIDDPYGGDLELYRRRSASIRRAVRRLYAKDVIRRTTAESEDTSGSHAAGLFSRALREFEREVIAAVQSITGVAPRPKATLGEAGNIISKSGRAAELASHIASVNQTWVKIKHGRDPELRALLEALHETVTAYDLLPGESELASST